MRGIYLPNHGLWFWTGAPCSPRLPRLAVGRTWAENGISNAFTRCATVLTLGAATLLLAQKNKRYRPLLAFAKPPIIIGDGFLVSRRNR